MTKPLTVLYARISTNDFQDVTNQQLAAKAAGWAIDVEFLEEGVSGTVPPMKRPEFSRMMSMLPRGSRIVVSAQDRLTRNTKDLLVFIDEIKDMGIGLFILQYPSLDCASPMGIMVLTIACSISAMELANLKYRVKMGLARTKAEGTILGGKAPALKNSFDIYFIGTQIDAGVSQKKIAEKLGVHVNTVGRLYIKYIKTGKELEYIAYHEKAVQQRMKSSA